MRRIAVIVAVVVAVAVAPQAASGQGLYPTFACSPLPGDCTGWYRSDVLLSWDWDGNAVVPVDEECSPRWFRSDTSGTWASCTVKPLTAQSPKYTAEVLIRLDKTPPTVTSATPTRAPDYGGWYNHPVSFAFHGADATSGLASCGTGAYGGPEGAGVRIAGTCRDVAGNVGAGSFALNYDATPPAAPSVEAMPANAGAELDWTPAAGAALYQVMRQAPGAGPVTVFTGAAPEFTDRRLRNGVRYRYTVAAIDRAGNRAAGSADVVPTSSKLILPAPKARVSSPPVLVWKPVKRASYYNVQLYRGRTKILTRWPRVARLALKSTWGYQGRRRKLRPGLYHWYVWPGYGDLSKHRYGKRLGESTFRVVR
ncbi:MAG TPA: hypothetical protein VGF25_06735 [Thermoleophilaceae bacterium]